MFAGWTRWYHWCIAVYFRFLASKALNCTLYHAEQFSVSQFQPCILSIWTRTQPVLLSISNLLGAVLCLPRLCLPQGLEPTAKPTAKPAPKAAKPRARPSTKSAAEPAAHVAARSATGEAILVAPVEHVQLFSGSNTPARKSGTQSLFLSRAEHASQQAVPGSFCGSYGMGMWKIGLRPGGGHGCRLKEGGGGFGKWTPVTGPMYGPHCQPFFLVCYTLSDF